MGGMNPDTAILAALVERWRSETHTFHFSFGEMIVTLQYVSCMWGLQVSGELVTSISDDDYDSNNRLFKDLLGVDDDNPIRKKSTWRMKTLEYVLSVKELWEIFANFLDESSQEDVERYTRAFIMNIFRSIMFVDNIGDIVPLMYLQFLRDLHNSRCYNCDAAVLACLYRQLCFAATPGNMSLSGPVILLHMWSWTRIPIGRPEQR